MTIKTKESIYYSFKPHGSISFSFKIKIQEYSPYNIRDLIVESISQNSADFEIKYDLQEDYPILTDNSGETVKVIFVLFVSINFLLFCLYLFRQLFLFCFISGGQLKKSRMADCAFYIVLINSFKNLVKFRNPFLCLSDLMPFALRVFFRFVNTNKFIYLVLFIFQ